MKTSLTSIWVALIALTILIFVTPANAAGDNGRRFVTNLSIHDTGHVIVTLDALGAQIESCTTPNRQNTMILDKNDERFKNMYAMLLLAYSSKTPIQGWVSGCIDIWGDGTAKFPRILTLSLVP